MHHMAGCGPVFPQGFNHLPRWGMLQGPVFNAEAGQICHKVGKDLDAWSSRPLPKFCWACASSCLTQPDAVLICAAFTLYSTTILPSLL